MIYQTISKSDFRGAFQRMGRKDNFSYNGLGVIYDYLEEVYTANKEDYELDVITLCCDFSEYTLEELRKGYGRPDKEEESDEKMMEYFNDHTTVIMVDDSTVIIGAF